MLEREWRDGVAVLRLCHGKVNALDLDLVRGVAGALEDVWEDARARALVITGAGSTFSAGVDLHRVLREDAAYVRAFLPALTRLFRQLFAFPRPAVAALNGHAIAGGYVLAAACDARIMAADSGTVGVPELAVGVPFPYVAIEILRFVAGPARLQTLVYRGALYGAVEAAGLGLVDETVSPEDVLDGACDLAARLASDPTGRFLLAKQQLRRPALDRMDRFGSETDDAVLAEWTRPETLAAIRDYLERLREGRA